MRSIVGVIVLVMLIASVVLAQSHDNNLVKPSFDQSPSTCIRQIPDSVRTAINEEIAARTKNASLSLEAITALKNAVISLNENDPVANAERRRAITEAGGNSIPVIAEMLLSLHEKTRENAVLALSYLQPLPSSGITEASGDQNLRVMLLRVGILDKSPTIRRSAIRHLARIGYANPRNMPEGIIEGIDSAMDDPDPRLKRIAETEKEALTLAAEVAQSRSEDLSDTSGVSGPSQNK